MSIWLMVSEASASFMTVVRQKHRGGRHVCSKSELLMPWQSEIIEMAHPSDQLPPSRPTCQYFLHELTRGLVH